MILNRTVIHNMNFIPKKRFGQHFLIDKNIADKIVNSANICSDDIVWEIGSGKGILTEKLVNKAKKVVAFEIDRDLAIYLKDKIKNENFILINKDVLKLDWDTIINADEDIKIVANLPYQISSPFLYKIENHISAFDSLVLMIQKEVAERIIAYSNSKKYGKLSLKMQYYFQIERLFNVPPHLFFPSPKVISTVIRLTKKHNFPVVKNIDLFWQIINLAFLHRRKMLRTNISVIFNEDIFREIIRNSPVDLNRRGESLSLEEFITLADYIDKKSRVQEFKLTRKQEENADAIK